MRDNGKVTCATDREHFICRALTSTRAHGSKMPAMDKESASTLMVLCTTASGKVTRGALDLPASSELFSIYYTSDSQARNWKV